MTKFHKMLALVMCVTMLCILVGCGSYSNNAGPTEPLISSEIISLHGIAYEAIAKSSDKNYYVFRETLTNFMYYGYLSSSSTGSRYDFLTPLYDPADRLPLTYSRYLELIAEGYIP